MDPGESKRGLKPHIFAASAIVLCFYLWTAGTNGVPFLVDATPEEYFKSVPTPCLFPDITPQHYGFYNLMADAFEAGRLDLLIKPPEEMLALENPRDPEQNQKWRILDLSIYKGKYYLYFGPVPTLLLFLPLRWAGIGKISEPLAVAIFSYGIYLCGLFIILYCIKKFIPQANRRLVVASIFSFAFSSAIPYNLRHPVVYELALTASAFFALLGLAFLLRAWETGRFHKGFLVAASFSLGLSVGCRPIYLFAIVFLFFLWLAFSIRKFEWKDSLLTGFAMAGPFIAVLIPLGIYNYARFGSILQFGIDFQTNATLWNPIYAYRFAYIAPGIFLRAFCPPHFNDVFPFIHLRQFYPFELPEGYSLEEVSAGFLATTPIIPLFLIAALVWNRKIEKTTIYAVSALFILFGCLFLVIESYMMFCNSMRYQSDFAPYITMGSLLGVMAVDSGLKAKTTRPLLHFAFFAAMVVGIVIHIAFSITGFRDTFRRGEPTQYFAIEKLFRPVSNIVSNFVAPGPARIIDVTTPSGSVVSGDGTTGIPLGGEGIHIRIYSNFHSDVVLSGNIELAPGAPPDLKIQFESPRSKAEIAANRNQSFQQRIPISPGANTISIHGLPGKNHKRMDPSERFAIIKNLNISK